MTTIKTSIVYTIIICIILTFLGCKKYLDEKSNQKLVVPTTVQDLQSLLDDYSPINRNFPGAGEASSDSYFLDDENWASRDEYVRRLYIWDEANLFQPGNNDWTNTYRKIYIANVVLENIDKIKRNAGDENEWANTKGTALFLRAISFIQLAWIFSPAYDLATATSDLGIPLRLDPDFNKSSKRSSVQLTYEQVIKDLETASKLLPTKPVHVMRPSKPAAYGWLARTYLSMRQYDSAFIYADKYLAIHNILIDFNDLKLSASAPIESYNIEVIYHSTLSAPITTARNRIDTLLYSLYAEDDLRKYVMFTKLGPNEYRFKGSYDGSNSYGSWFNGIATDEMYLTRAECLARKRNISEAMADLNTLIIRRWKNSVQFPPLTASTVNEAVDKILVERRKELYMRGVRWMDIKRLNKEGVGIIIKRYLNGETYILHPGNPRYVLPIPEDVIEISGMQQNRR